MTTKRERKAEVRKLVLEGVVPVAVYQVRPNTMVIVYSVVNRATYSALGFSKVTWRDTWDPATGTEIATKKAVAKIVRAVLAGEPLAERSYSLDCDAVAALYQPPASAPEAAQAAPNDGPACGVTDCAQGFGMPCEACGV